MRKLLESCPTCESHLTVTELSCRTCGTVIHGSYSPCPFCHLSPQNLAFLTVFVKNRGNVKDMERELGVSYWTIRNRLNEVIHQMGFAGNDSSIPNPSAHRRQVLEQLENGDITVEEAAELLAAIH